MSFKFSSNFDCENIPEQLLWDDIGIDEVPAYLDEHEDDIEKLNEHVYLVFVRDYVAFYFVINDNNEIIDMCELTKSPKHYDFKDDILLILDDPYQSYYSNATVYRITPNDINTLLEADGE